MKEANGFDNDGNPIQYGLSGGNVTTNAKGMKCPHCHKEIVLSESVGGEYLKTFKFLDNPEEDIYTENDGKPIKHEAKGEV